MFDTFENYHVESEASRAELLEMQYCKLKPGAPLKKIVAVRTVKLWEKDSLYFSAHDMDKFCANYENIFNNGVYGNQKQGPVDFFGINYYSPQQLTEIIAQIEKQKPVDYEILLDWLKRGIDYNGFYILGI